MMADAIGADTAGMAQPRNADAFADPEALHSRPEPVDPANDLMTGNDRRHRTGQFAVNDMQVRATDATGADLDANLAGPRLSIRELGPLKRRANRIQHHGLHGVRPPLR